jgi:hypothetical protein
MFISNNRKITSPTQAFLIPANATHRQYEALRAYFVDQLPSHEAAARFGYSAGSFRVLCHKFRQDLHRPFFLPDRDGAKRPDIVREPSTTARLRERVLELRKQNFSIYDIVRALRADGERISPPAVWTILHEEGFAKLPRRRDDERPIGPHPAKAPVADIRAFSLAPREFRTDFGGIFLFVPMLVELGFEQILRHVDLPGTAQVPATCAMRSLLALKLFGSARHSHVMSSVFDAGLALFAGLNVIPKRSFLTEYSCRISPSCYPQLMQVWFDAMTTLGLERGTSFHLDFHTIPFHGEEALVEKHYVSKRSRRQKGLLAFLAQDAERRVFCYANADVSKAMQNDEILRFIEFWKARTGRLPEELIFDSKLTTYANLHELNRMEIRFITLRRRTEKLVAQLLDEPASAWRTIALSNVTRAYRTPRIIDRRIQLDDYEGEVRQIAIADLGHEEPTLLLTNQLRRSAVDLIDTYARRMLIENSISDGIDFFHMDALSSAVALKVNCDLQLTLMANSLYRMMGARIGGAYATAESRHIFRDFVNASARVVISDQEVQVQFGKRAHNPLLLGAGFADRTVTVPWWEGRKLSLSFG